MEVRVLFFASIREKLRCRETVCSLPPGATVGDLLAQLCREYPAIADHRRSVSTAVNREYVDAAYRLSDNDEVALIPPVSGGCGDCPENGCGRPPCLPGRSSWCEGGTGSP